MKASSFNVKEKFRFLDNETSMIAYLDLSNMFYWQRVLKWNFRVEDIIYQLFSYPNIKEVKVYYGENNKNEEERRKSKALHKRIQKTGAILRSKEVKFIKKTIDEALLFKQSTITLFNNEVNKRIERLINEIKKTGLIYVEEPKCNFDVELSLDMIDDSEKISAVMLFSGDCDFMEPLERLKIKGKQIYIVGVRGMVSKELHNLKNKYIDFGKFYYGKKRYQSENPAKSRTA
ncbi:MAG: NYN domain-containing protein [Candidatus Pacebacteria bacterium]|nr:NYN domain-containing protein [Candidatus Paceibacterota bacterium]